MKATVFKFCINHAYRGFQIGEEALREYYKIKVVTVEYWTYFKPLISMCVVVLYQEVCVCVCYYFPIIR